MIEARYRKVIEAVEAEFARNRSLHGARIRCGPGCTECCHHLFAITRFEADQVARGCAALPDQLRREVQTRAARYIEDALVRGQRLPCPALQEGRCSIYEYRPLLCRKFGMPLYNPDQPDRILACELNFASGEEIHDPQLIRIQTEIHQQWKELKRDLPPTSERLTVAHAILQAKG